MLNLTFKEEQKLKKNYKDEKALYKLMNNALYGKKTKI